MVVVVTSWSRFLIVFGSAMVEEVSLMVWCHALQTFWEKFTTKSHARDAEEKQTQKTLAAKELEA